MELNHIVVRLVEALHRVDAQTTTVNYSRPTAHNANEPYLLGVGTLKEHQFCAEAMQAWVAQWPNELPGYSQETWLESLYPTPKKKGAKKGDTCDICLVSSDYAPTAEIPFEWALEVKAIRFVGDNGKINEFAVNKTVSPYRSARSSVLDAHRLPNFTGARRKAVIWYGFEFDSASVAAAVACGEAQEVAETKAKYFSRAKELRAVIGKESPPDGKWTVEPMYPLFEAAAGIHGVHLSARVDLMFDGLQRHPLFRRGRIAAWEIL